MKKRICSICGKEIIIGYNGRNYCKKCDNEKSKKYYLINKKSILNKANKYYKNNTDKVCIRVKKRREILLKQEPWMRAYYSIKARCGSKLHLNYINIENYLKRNDLKFLWFRDKAYLLKQPSIDRLDATKDYTIDNCRYIEYKDNIKRTWFKIKPLEQCIYKGREKQHHKEYYRAHKEKWKKNEN